MSALEPNFSDRVDALASEGRDIVGKAREEINALLAQCDEINEGLAKHGIHTRVDLPMHANAKFRDVRMTAKWSFTL